MANNARIKIVIVEDEEATRDITKTTLSKIGNVDVYATDNGADAVRLVKEHQPDLVIQDLQIKGSMSGWDCIREYRTFNDQVKIIISSCYSVSEFPDSQHLLNQYFVNAVLMKLYSREVLIEKVKKVLSEDSSYQDYGKNRETGSSVRVSDEAEFLIHAINSKITCLHNKCESYWLEYTADPVLGNRHDEVSIKTTKLLKECVLEIEDIFKEVENIKFLGLFEFQLDEFNESLTPEALLKAINIKGGIEIPITKTPIHTLNKLLKNQDLYKSMEKKPEEALALINCLEKGQKVSPTDIKKLNRILIYANFPTEAPKRQFQR